MASSIQHMVSSCILICEVNLKDSDTVFTNPHVSFQSCRAVFKEEIMKNCTWVNLNGDWSFKMQGTKDNKSDLCDLCAILQVIWRNILQVFWRHMLAVREKQTSLKLLVNHCSNVRFMDQWFFWIRYFQWIVERSINELDWMTSTILENFSFCVPQKNAMQVWNMWVRKRQHFHFCLNYSFNIVWQECSHTASICFYPILFQILGILQISSLLMWTWLTL